MAKPQILVDIDKLYKRITKGTGTLLTTNWEDVVGTYKKRYSFIINGVTSSDVVDISLDKDSLDIALDAEMCPTSESYDGGVYIYAKSEPSSAITFSYIIFK